MHPLQPRWSSYAAPLGVVGLALLLGGCAEFFSHPRQTQSSSSVVNFLYPREANPLPPTAIPVLRLPLRVGIAFVPTGSKGQAFSSRFGPSEVQKNTLMQRVADEFKGREYIQSIEIVPTSYLRPEGGFANLDQVRGLLGVDVIALVAYDQVQFTNENILSLAYWTIVGAYIFQGNKNDSQTLMEAAVYDIESRHLLFRAPGASQVQASAAAVYVDQDLRADSAKGFDLATNDLIKNLKVQLEDFRTRVKASPGEVKIEHKPGYTGGGALGGEFVAALAVLGLSAWLARKKSGRVPAAQGA
jgi:rhombotail lipoprotein